MNAQQQLACLSHNLLIILYKSLRCCHLLSFMEKQNSKRLQRKTNNVLCRTIVSTDKHFLWCGPIPWIDYQWYQWPLIHQIEYLRIFSNLLLLSVPPRHLRILYTAIESPLYNKVGLEISLKGKKKILIKKSYLTSGKSENITHDKHFVNIRRLKCESLNEYFKSMVGNYEQKKKWNYFLLKPSLFNPIAPSKPSPHPSDWFEIVCKYLPSVSSWPLELSLTFNNW